MIRTITINEYDNGREDRVRIKKKELSGQLHRDPTNHLYYYTDWFERSNWYVHIKCSDPELIFPMYDEESPEGVMRYVRECNTILDRKNKLEYIGG
jgi:hypothetical protein